MRWYRILTLIYKHFLLIPHDFHRLIDIMYWPLLDILDWGFTGLWIQKNQIQLPEVTFMLLTGLLLWHVIYRAHIEIAFNFLDELWSQNLINLFSSPLQLSEWIIAVLILGFFSSCFSLFFNALIVWLFFGLNIFLLGYTLITFFFCSVISGWWLGFFATALITYWGKKIQMLVWVIGYFFMPFSAVYYSIDILPKWAQYIGYSLPMTYIFQAMRLYIQKGIFSSKFVLISMGLNILYLTGSLLFFKFMFKKSKQKGLARLERFE